MFNSVASEYASVLINVFINNEYNSKEIEKLITDYKQKCFLERHKENHRNK